ncbi:hypothetical protein KC460_04925 [Candidatus Dependentiae bacterium]|nr:hypothetical protein [Candidatus Dependentiae bacterium]
MKYLLVYIAFIIGIATQPIHAEFTWTGYILAASTWTTGLVLACTAAYGNYQKKQTRTDNCITNTLAFLKNNKKFIITTTIASFVMYAPIDLGVYGKKASIVSAVHFAQKHALGYIAGFVTTPLLIGGCAKAIDILY